MLPLVYIVYILEYYIKVLTALIIFVLIYEKEKIKSTKCSCKENLVFYFNGHFIAMVKTIKRLIFNGLLPNF